MTKHGELYAGPLDGGLREFCERRKSETGRIEMHPNVALKLLDEKEAAEARCAELEAALEGCLQREKERAETQGLSDCACMNFSRTAENEYETGQCPHQIARSVLSGSPAPVREAPLPRLETLKGVKYLAQDSDGQWHYINHANTWQMCPPPFEQLRTEAERAVVEAAMNRRVALRNKHGVVSRDAQLKDACDNLAKLRETGGE